MATNNGYPKLQPIHPIFSLLNLVLLPSCHFAEDVHSTGFHPQSGSSVFIQTECFQIFQCFIIIKIFEGPYSYYDMLSALIAWL